MALVETEYVWRNGKVLKWGDAQVHGLAHGLQYGVSVFEGIRAYTTISGGPRVFKGREHFERLHFSARSYRLPLPYTVDALLAATDELLEKNGLGDAYIRPVVVAPYGQMGPGAQFDVADVMIFAMPSNAESYPSGPKQPISVGISSWRRPPPGTLPVGAKASGNYLSSRLIALEARQNGYDDGIALSHDGLVSEAQASNVFVVKDGIVYTPSASSGILEGITRDVVLSIAQDEGLKVHETALSRETLYDADEIFLTGTASEIVPVGSVDGISVVNQKFDRTRAMQTRYFDLCKMS